MMEVHSNESDEGEVQTATTPTRLSSEFKAKLEGIEGGRLRTDGKSLFEYGSRDAIKKVRMDKMSTRYKRCFAKSEESAVPCVPPDRLIELKAACPLKLCGREEHDWTCQDCFRSISCDTDGNCYCNCGRRQMTQMSFCCADPTHEEFIAYEAEHLAAIRDECRARMQLESKPQYHQHMAAPVPHEEPVPHPTREGFVAYEAEHLAAIRDECRARMQLESKPQEINILLLGETGVGKSTFINSLANYAAYDDFEAAMQEGPIVLIRSKVKSVTVNSDGTRSQKIVIVEADEQRDSSSAADNDEYECLETGQSATRHVRAYPIKFGNKIVRLIDAPGIADTAGIDSDSRHFDEIWSYLNTLDVLHGICILTRAKENRLSPEFKYCIEELLCRLHHTAAQNIVFCFTNARSCDYIPEKSDTLELLTAMTEKIFGKQQIPIRLDPDTTLYCVDNEPFNVLCKRAKELPVEGNERKHCAESWQRSLTESMRLLTYVINREPHVLKLTLSINEARALVANLVKPMVDLACNIEHNVQHFEDKRYEISKLSDSDRDLSKKLIMEKIVLKSRRLDEPALACNNAKCVEYHKVEGTNETSTVHKKLCVMDYTWWKLVIYLPRFALGRLGLAKCSYCSCAWKDHVSVNYEQVIQTEVVEDEIIKDLLAKKISAREAIQRSKVLTEKLQCEFVQERETVAKIGVYFATILVVNSIKDFNEAFKDYLELQLKVEKDNKKIHQRLSDMLKQHNTQVKEFFSKTSASKERPTSSDWQRDIKEAKDTLFKLKHSGSELKNLYRQHAALANQFTAQNEHPVVMPPITETIRNTAALWQ